MSESVKFTEKNQKAAADAFRAYDKKDEGQIKVGDIEFAMKKMALNVKSEFLEKFEDQIDTEGTGYIGLEEFITIAKKKMQEDEDERELRDIFRVLDKDKKGEVNVSELRWILKNLGDDLTEEDIDDMIADVDTDGSGWVDYDEFAHLMLSE